MKNLAGSILLWVLAASAYGQQAVLEYVYSESFIENTDQNQILEEFTRLLQTDLEQAAEFAYDYSNKLLNAEEHAENTALAGQILSNAAVADAALGRYQRASEAFERALRLIEVEYRVFSPNLMNVLLASGITAIHLGKLAEAEDRFRWAQHIQHRQAGVFTIEQTESLDWLTRLHLTQNQFANADMAQRIGLRIAEHNYEYGSDSLSDAKLKAAGYFAERGSKLPFGVEDNYLLSRENMFRESVVLYKAAIASIESSYGEDDPRLIEPLRNFARTRTTQRTSARTAIPILKRVLSIVAKQTEIDPIDYLRAWVELGDIYIITGDKRAHSAYASAWERLEKLPDKVEELTHLFAKPKLLYPANLGPIYLENRPKTVNSDEDEFYADIRYLINENGRVSKIEIEDKNVPNSYIRILKNVLYNSRYRPSLIDGTAQEFTMTERRPFGLLISNEEPTDTVPAEQDAEPEIEIEEQTTSSDTTEPAPVVTAEAEPAE